MNSTVITVIDDTAVTRRGVVEELREAGFDVTGVGSLDEWHALSVHRPCDVAVVDLYLHGPHGPPGFDAIELLTEAGVRVVVHSTWALDPDIFAALAAGAVSFVQKGTSTQALVSTLQRAATSEPGGPPVVSAEVAGAVKRRERFRLTPAEVEVLTLVSQHLSNSEIAELRCVSEDTIKTQLASIRGKLGSTTRSEAVRAARTFGLLGRWSRRESDR